MLTKRIIPCLDVTLDKAGGCVVKGIEFVNLKEAGDPVQLAKKYNEQGADELVFLDITASHERRGTMIELENGTKAWYEVVIYGGRTPTGLDTVQWAQKVEKLGSGEILLTSMDK